jgi:hypothetical protein
MRFRMRLVVCAGSSGRRQFCPLMTDTGGIAQEPTCTCITTCHIMIIRLRLQVMLFGKCGIRCSCFGLCLPKDCTCTCEVSRLLARNCWWAVLRETWNYQLSCRQQGYALLDHYHPSYHAYVRLDNPNRAMTSLGKPKTLGAPTLLTSLTSSLLLPPLRNRNNFRMLRGTLKYYFFDSPSIVAKIKMTVYHSG